ncbi:MAG: molybdate ABC transporter substrate-binding protein [Microbacterium pygmaeum]
MRVRPLIAATAAALLLLAGCASSDAGGGATATATPSATTSALEGDLTVFAAASLKAAFDEIAVAFEEENPGVDVLPITYDGSSTLATQIIEGAPVDVFASADEKNMTKVTDEDLIASTELFATNTLVVALPPGNPAGVDSLDDLADPATTVVLCAPEVPCGAASQTLLTNAGLAVTPVSLEQNVTAVLTKVAADEADAGLVYKTDVANNDAVESFAPDGAADVVNSYPIGALADSANPDAAAAFAAFVTGERGQEILASYGFGAP